MAKSCYVDQDICIGCGLCVSIADSIFTFNDEGKAENYLGEINQDLINLAEEAASNCPVDAIKID